MRVFQELTVPALKVPKTQTSLQVDSVHTQSLGDSHQETSRVSLKN